MRKLQVTQLDNHIDYSELINILNNNYVFLIERASIAVDFNILNIERIKAV